jgi:hypothetical protein
MTYNNIIDVYNRMVDVSNQLHEEHSFEAIGYDKALFTLQYAIKQYVSVNLHLENKSLTRQLELAESKLKECHCKRDEILRVNNKLLSENENLKSEINSLRKLYQKVSANKMLK